MTPATWPRAEPLDERLLVVDPEAEAISDFHVRDLPALLSAGDTLVVNDAATLPASLHTMDRRIEVRLLARGAVETDWRALLFGPGDWRTPTEARSDPARVERAERLEFGDRLAAVVVAVDPESPRLVELRFESQGAELWRALYEIGKPVQYSYLTQALPLWHVQNRFVARPWALEMPSAGRPLTWGLLTALRRRQIDVTFVTHAAGISSTGSGVLDGRFPIAEHYLVGDEACAVITATKKRGGRVIAAGTTVVRALESCAAEHDGMLVSTEADATLVLGPGFRPRVVDGLLTGMHERTTSHFALMEAFAPRHLLERAMTHASDSGYLAHEFGDSCLVVSRR